MFAMPETYQVGITSWFRGPERAFVIRQGDLRALEEVVAHCCNLWNGANNLIVPVRSDGRTWPVIGAMLDVRPVEATLVHDAVPKLAVQRLKRSLGSRAQLWMGLREESDNREIHPLLLQPSYQRDAERVLLRIPRLEGRRLQRIAMVCWGRVREEDRDDYESAFRLEDAHGPVAHAAIVDGQLDQLAPIEQTVRLIEAYGSNPPFTRILAVLPRGSFTELVAFWNFRSRVRGVRGRPLMIGVPSETLDQPDALRSLADWIESDPLFDVCPDLGLWTSDELRGRAGSAIEAAGFTHEAGNRISRRFLDHSLRGRPLSYSFFAPRLGGSFRRGALAHQQITLTQGRASFRLARPDGFGMRTGHYVRVALEGLPLSLPLSSRSAGLVTANAYRSPDGVTIMTDAHVGDGYLQVGLPDAWKELEGWAAESGWAVERSQAGRYAQALLDRLRSLEDLDALAANGAVEVLAALAPLSRRKLAQRVVAQVRHDAGARLDERTLADHLERQALFLELRARTANDIATQTQLRKRVVLGVLSPLIEHKFVTRGAAADCPRCHCRQVLSLSEQDEMIACRACGYRFVLPVTEAGGQQERAPVYRLDGLMARAMDQDLLPVLLTIRTLAETGLSNDVRAAWPGLELTRAGDKLEVDLLLSDGDRVWICECKANAAGLQDQQLDGLLALAEELSARPALAALSGRFADEQRRRVEVAKGRVLDGGELVDVAS